MAVTPEEFKGALRRWASGVTVITARVGEVDIGMTASSFSSLSLAPPQVLVCVAKTAGIHGALGGAGGFGVTVLAEDQMELSNRFAGRFPAGQDRFADLALTRGPFSGAALLPGGLVTLDCRVVHAFDGGDHTIFVGEVEHVAPSETLEAHQALLYLAGRYRKVGDAI